MDRSSGYEQTGTRQSPGHLPTVRSIVHVCSTAETGGGIAPFHRGVAPRW